MGADCSIRNDLSTGESLRYCFVELYTVSEAQDWMQHNQVVILCVCVCLYKNSHKLYYPISTHLYTTINHNQGEMRMEDGRTWYMYYSNTRRGSLAPGSTSLALQQDWICSKVGEMME